MFPEELRRAFRRAPIYVFCGEEDLFKSEGIAFVRSALLSKGSDLSACAEFDGDTAEMGTILDELRTQSLFAPERVVILERADRFFGLKRAKSGAQESFEEGEEDPETADTVKVRRDLLLKYLDAPAEFSALVITTEVLWDKRLKLTKRVEEVGCLVECKRPYESKIPQWLMARARQHHGKRLASLAAELLAVDGGQTLGELDLQLAKLATYVGDRPEITEADVQDVVGHAGYHVIFKLTDAVAFRRAGEALRILRDLLFHGATEPQVLAMLAWGSRRLWGARKLEKAGLPASEVCKQLRVSDYFADKFLGQVRQFSDSELERNHRLILEADIASKSGHSPEVVLDQLIVQLCR